MTDNTLQSPAQWLIQQFEAASTCNSTRPGQRRSVVTQPMYRLKNALDAGKPMRVTQSDYRLPGRVWL